VDDVGLVERILLGDEAAFSQLFQRHKASVYRYAVHMRGGDGRASADDIVQEVFLAFLRQASRFDASRGTVVGYLLGIARRQLFRQIGQERPDDPIDDAAPVAAPDGDPFEGLSRKQIVDHVRAAIAALPPVFREAVVLCELNELDYADAADVIGCPIGTVRSRLHRARALLMKALDRSWKKTSIA
jgi:RNA polymerase sigma-70 factor, ECF subfamily